jgi:hypothetical protein
MANNNFPKFLKISPSMISTDHRMNLKITTKIPVTNLYNPAIKLMIISIILISINLVYKILDLAAIFPRFISLKEYFEKRNFLFSFKASIDNAQGIALEVFAKKTGLDYHQVLVLVQDNEFSVA